MEIRAAQSNINFQRLFESSPGLYLILLPNQDFIIAAASDAYLHATMTKREEILGRGLFDVFPDNPNDPGADGVSNLRFSLSAVLHNKTPQAMAVQKYAIRKPDGSFETKFWSPLNTPVLNAEGEIEYITHRIEDVTEFIRLKQQQLKSDKITQGLMERVEEMESEIYIRAQEIQKINAELEKKIEERTKELAVSANRFRDTLDNMLEGVQIIGFDWKYIYVNNSMTRHGKYRKEEFIGHTVMEKYPGIEETELFKVYQRCFTERIAIQLENEFVFPDRSKGWFEFSFQPVPEGIFILSVDITQRKAAEEKLMQTVKEISDYKKALDEAAIVAITDQKGIITHVNDNFCRISGYTAEELIGSDHRIINSGYHSKAFVKNLWVTIANGKRWKGEFKNKAKDGTFYWVEATIVPFLDQKKKPYQYLSIRTDITARKQAEEEIAKMNCELEQKIIERTAELEAFSYSVSHDLRAPLRAVDGFANMLYEDFSDRLDEEAKRLLGIIQYNAKQMGVLIDDLLTFSRLGRKNLQKTQVNMQQLLNDVLADAEKNFPYKAEIKTGKILPAPADVMLIKQVLVNLISNALKYSSKTSKPVIEITSQEENCEVVYVVKDNGVGFDMQYASKLFGVFQRLHRAEEFEGTGVGLATVQRIIKKHEGRVWAEATVGKGASFHFSLPLN